MLESSAFDPKLYPQRGGDPWPEGVVPLDIGKITGESRRFQRSTGRGLRGVVFLPRRAIKAGGNANTARWRQRHGSAWLCPLNKRFKVRT